ncbi:GNAT family N-acetyltransferase [Anaerotruncus colihominis]|uniref:GNAT family N-acetyltransferase n=1 Tax=Anaerotruncus colihominis TaxID=169435 RepID=UPI00267362AC|nr:GNAT family N-acetyltransferase [Anaerotruncus colihominis]
MIRFVTPELEALFCEKSVQFGIFGAKIYSQYQTYGAQSGILDMWLLFDDTYVTGCVSRFGGLLTAACTPRADVEELAVFLRAVGGRAVEGMLPLIERVRAVTRGELCSSHVMRADSRGCLPAPAPCGADGAPCPADRLVPVYALLCAADPLFAARADEAGWLTELSHKTRHGLAEIYILKVKNSPISTSGIYFKGTDSAILAGVATVPAMRGRGYGRRLVEHTTAAALAQGLTPYLLTADDRLGAFYTACGFMDAGQWARLEW